MGYQSEFKIYIQQNRCLNYNYLINSIFEEGNRLFAISFENETDRGKISKHYVMTVEVKE